jgi:hypothetical protein
MSPTHAAKKGRRWRYYVSQAILQGRKQEAGSLARVGAIEVEHTVAEALRAVLSASDDQRSSGSLAGQRMTSSGPADLHVMDPDVVGNAANLRAAVERVVLSQTKIEIELAESAAGDDQNRILIIPWTPPSPHRRREIIHGEGDRLSATRPMKAKARAILIDALRDAHRWLNELTTNSNQSVESLAAREGRTERSIRMTLSLAFLSPALAQAAVDGRLPCGFGVKRLMDLPLIWPDQWRALGLAAPAEA